MSMAPQKPRSKRSKTTRNGRAAMKLKKLSQRRSKRREARLRKMVCEEVNKQVQQFFQTVLAWLMSTSGSLLNQAKSSVRRKLQLHFDCKLPEDLFTSDSLCADGTQANLPLTVVLLDEDNNIIKDGPLSSLKIEIFVVDGDFEAKESEEWTEEVKRSTIRERKGKGPLLDGSCVSTMENGVVCFNKIKFTDNSSWVRSKKFRLGAKVAEGVRMPGMVEIRPAVSGAFRVKDQHGKQYAKHTIPSLDDAVWRLEKIKKDGEHHRNLEAEGISSVKDFLQKYYMDQSSLRRILGAKSKAWEAIVEHATLCSLNNEHFQYESETGVELLFNCVYKLVGISFDHQNVRSLETLDEDEKYLVENLRRRALENQSKLVSINFPAGWPFAKISSSMVPYPNQQGPLVPANPDNLVMESYPQTPLLDSPCVYHQPEEPTAQSIGIIGDIRSLVRSDTLLKDSINIAGDNHPLSMPHVNLTWNYMSHGQASNYMPATIAIGNESDFLMAFGSLISHMEVISPNLNGGVSKTANLWYRARVAVSKRLIALRGTARNKDCNCQSLSCECCWV